MPARRATWRPLGKEAVALNLPGGPLQPVEVEVWEAEHPADGSPAHAVQGLLGRVNGATFLHFAPRTLRFAGVVRGDGPPVVYRFEYLASGWPDARSDQEYAQPITRRLVSGFALLFTPHAH
jgi:hypothetical protein